MNFPQSLLSSIRDGSVVLYLGQRAFEDALHPEGKKYPDAPRLTELLSRTFLDGKYGSSKIETVLEFCEHGHGLDALQDFFREVFAPFRPSEWHSAVTRFPWKAVITTDVSTILEEAFAMNPDSPVQLVPFYRNGQRVDDELVSRRHIPYLKLRGTVGSVDRDVLPAPFIDQRLLGIAGRERLLERACELALEYPVLFVGHSYEDADV